MKQITILLIAGALVAFLLLGLTAQGGDKCQSCAPVTFNHQFHLEEVGAECAACHQNVSASKTANDNLNPSMDLCAECHDVEDKAGCNTCHADPANVVPTDGIHKNYDVFEHRDHIEAGYSCQTCHSAIEKSTGYSCGRQALPTMAECMECHRSEGQTMQCSACHSGKHPQPGDHTFTEWTKTHGLEAAFDPAMFQEYFELGYCEDCHQGLNLKGEVHQTGWMFVHGDEAASGGDCMVCHEDRASCSDCHRMMLPVPHPLGDPGFANPENGGGHKGEAEAYYEACLSCHDQGAADATCARCH